MKTLLGIVLSIFSLQLLAQNDPLCKDLNTQNLKELNQTEYTSDGKFYAFKLNEGEKMDIYKPFYSSKEYCIMVSCEDCLPGVEVTLLNMDKTIVFASKEPQQKVEINYKPQKNQNLIISLTIGKNPIASNTKSINKGCVSMIVGYK